MAIKQITSSNSPITLSANEFSQLVNIPYLILAASGGGTIEVNLPSINSINKFGQLYVICEDGSTTVNINTNIEDVISEGGVISTTKIINGDKAFLQLNATTYGTGNLWLGSTNGGGGGGGGGAVILLGNGVGSSVRCGQGNNASGNCSTISGGYCNTASGAYSTVGGGNNNTASCYNSTVGGGLCNTSSNYNSTVSGGRENTALGSYSTVSGGRINTALGSYSTVSGGYNNTSSNQYSTVGGGLGNTSSNQYSTISGGRENTALGSYSTVSGGRQNTVSCYNSTVSGGQLNTASGAYSTVGGGNNNTSSGYNSTVSGGICNTSSNQYSTVSGGNKNTSSGYCSTVSGGYLNTASCYASTVGGGLGNTASGYCSTVGGGTLNTASGYISTVSGGSCNTSSNLYSTVGGGFGNLASNCYSTISGGLGATAYLYGQQANANGFFSATSDSQVSTLISRREATLNSSATAPMSLDGTGVTNLIIPQGNNRAWQVLVEWVIVCTNLGTGTTGGLAVGNIHAGADAYYFKRVGGTASISAITNLHSKNDSGMSNAVINYSVGGSNDLLLTLQAPNSAGTASSFRANAVVRLTELAW